MSVDRIRCAYGKPSMYDARANCTTSSPGKPEKWCAHCLVRDYRRIAAVLEAATKRNAVATPLELPQAAVATDPSSSSSLLPGIDTDVQERLIAEAEALLTGITPGQWKLWNGWGPDSQGFMRVERIGVDDPLAWQGIQTDFESSDIRGRREDLEFIAHAPRIVRQLLDQLQSLVVPARTGEAGTKTKEGRDGEA